VTFQEMLETSLTVMASLGGGGAIVFGFSGYLGKLWAGRALESQRLENARILERQRQDYAQLNLEFNHQLGLITERTKNALQIATLEHQVRFSRLHERRARAIEALDKRAYELEIVAARYVSTLGGGSADQDASDMYNDVRDKLLAFDAYRDSHRVYLSDDLDALLCKFISAIRQPIVTIHVYGDNNEGRYKYKQQLIDALTFMTDEVPKIRTILIKEFRAILAGTGQRRAD
jgi:hypothetical protein